MAVYTGFGSKSELESIPDSFGIQSVIAKGNDALSQVSKGGISKLGTQQPGATAAVEHSDDRREIDIVFLKPPQNVGATAAASDDDYLWSGSVLRCSQLNREFISIDEEDCCIESQLNG